MAVRLKTCSVGLSVTIIFILTSTIVSWDEGWTHYGSEFISVVKISPSTNATLIVPNVKYIKEGDEPFDIYCFINVPKSVFQIWRSVQLVLLDIPLKYNIYLGVNENEVQSNYQSKSIWHSSFMLSGSDAVIEFPAFSQYCVGVATRERYSLLLKVRTINYWKVLQTLFGIFLFLASPSLSRNSFFHYASGVSFGVLASFLILLYVISRFIPQKSASYAVLLFGSSFVFYFLNIIWNHLHDIITQYMDIILSYCIITAFLSFVICYRIGPVRSERTCNIIQWTMQGLSLSLIFLSSEYREISTAVILLLLIIKIIPTCWIKWIKFQWYRCFPPKVKLLSEVEYIEQGHVETKKALDNLRQYCSSPDCNVWKVVRQLKDPTRFASFIETGSHYTDQELLDYNTEDFDEYSENNDMRETEDLVCTGS